MAFRTLLNTRCTIFVALTGLLVLACTSSTAHANQQQETDQESRIAKLEHRVETLKMQVGMIGELLLLREEGEERENNGYGPVEHKRSSLFLGSRGRRTSGYQPMRGKRTFYMPARGKK